MTSDEAALLTRSAGTFGVLLDTAALERIDRHLMLLERWNRVVRLTGQRDRADIVARHVIDSLAAVRWMPLKGMTVDVGSGAGFPGIILACAKPEAEIVLIEARRRRASFLNEAVRAIPLPHARVIARRGEDVAADELREAARTAITRAVRAEMFLPLAGTLVASGGTAILMQTPDGAKAATSTAASLGFSLEGSFNYVLPDSRHRTLLAFRRA